MFDIARFLTENFGTPDGVVALAAKHNVEVPQRETVRKWFERGAVPGEKLLALLLIIKWETGAQADVEHYLTGGDGHDIFA